MNFQQRLTRLSPASGIRARHLKRFVGKIRAEGLSYLSEERLCRLCECVLRVEQAGIPGMMIEAGCALGGSSIVIAHSKALSRPFRIYDAFSRIPPPGGSDGRDAHQRYREIEAGSSQGIGGQQYYGYRDDLEGEVRENLRRFAGQEATESVMLIKGLFQKTLQVEQSVAFAHIDADWHDSVSVCLERIVPKLSVGGMVLIDDYSDWSGCRRATDEYFQKHRDRFQMSSEGGPLRVVCLQPAGEPSGG